MKLGSLGKILLALATSWPILYMGIFFAFVFSQLFFDLEIHGDGGGEGAFKILFVLHLLTMLWIIGLLAFYIVYLFRTERVAADKKALWAAVLLLGNMFAMPVFFYLYVWREPKEEAAVGKAEQL